MFNFVIPAKILLLCARISVPLSIFRLTEDYNQLIGSIFAREHNFIQVEISVLLKATCKKLLSRGHTLVSDLF